MKDKDTVNLSDDAFKAHWDEKFNAIGRVYSLRVGQTLTQEDFDAIQKFDADFRENEQSVTDAFHAGYTQGLRDGGSADIAQMRAKLDEQFIQFGVEKAMRKFAEREASELMEALQGVMPILGSAESNASGNPEWDYVGPRVAVVRALLPTPSRADNWTIEGEGL